METEDGFYKLKTYLETDRVLVRSQKKGYCRIWSGRARESIQQFAREHEHNWTVQVREVDVEPCLSHTFIRLIADGKAYLLDGTGVWNYPEYYGLESEAPEHLRNSHQDWLDRI